MRRAKNDSADMPGQDSFLDVVTNIVGILILLVMVVGVRASYWSADESPDPDAAAEGDMDRMADVRAARAAASNAQRDIAALVKRVVGIQQEVLSRDEERAYLATLIAAAEEEIAERRERLDSDQQRIFDLRRRMMEAQVTLDDLTREHVSLLSQPEEVVELEAQPTSLGREVTGKQIHVLLDEGHIAIVPFDEMLDQLQPEIERNLWRLKDQDELVGTIGPVEGFRLRYECRKVRSARRSSSGALQLAEFPVFDHAMFLPVTTPLGEPADQALLPNSELMQYVQRFDSDHVTVAIWVYPGNYDRLRQLKRALHELGYQTASWPRAEGEHIGVSPSGARSVAD